MRRWHLITGEYPPAFGGVADYSQLVATGLARAGDQVSVWAPEADGIPPAEDGIEVNRIPSRFGLGALRLIGRKIERHPGTLLVQYVPHSFGLKAMNLPFCLWLMAHRRRPVWLMFHEVAVAFTIRQPLRHNLIALINRAMATVATLAADRIFVSTNHWERLLRPLVGPRRAIEWLPVPSNIPFVNDLAQISRVRALVVPADSVLVGHFSSARDATMATTLAESITPAFAQRPRAHLMLLGDGSENLRRRIIDASPAVGPRISATGRLTATEMSFSLSASDLMFQPYPDGLSTRRTSSMATLAHHRALLTTRGFATETFWDSENAIALAPTHDIDAIVRSLIRLIDDTAERSRLATAGAQLYTHRFDVAHTIAALRTREAVQVRE